jgi:hypothetical protein
MHCIGYRTRTRLYAPSRAALIPGGKAQLRLVPAGARQSLENVVEETRRDLEMGLLLPGFSRSLSASHTRTVCHLVGAQWLPRPVPFHERSDVGFWIADGILLFLRGWLRRMGGSPARDRTKRLHQRCSGPLPGSSRPWQRRSGEFIERSLVARCPRTMSSQP